MNNLLTYKEFVLNEGLSNREKIVDLFNYFGDIKLSENNSFMYTLDEKIGKAYIYIDYKHVIVVDNFTLNKDHLNKNYTKMFFEQICKVADDTEMVIAFSPKVKVHSLKMFKDMGFVENLGKNKNRDIHFKLYRKPIKDENI
jgi:hypothetical protein